MLFNNILTKKVTVPAIVGTATFAIGFSVGYFVRGKSETKTETVEENEQMSLFDYIEDGVFDKKFDEEVEEIVEQFIEDVEVEHVNVFQTYNEQWDWDIELMHRQDNHIYVIHYDEFVNNESNYSQETLTYYAGDDILTDQLNTPIYDYEKMIGDIRFGHGSNDQNVVFIRNDQIHMEWEILRDEGKYQVEILGYEIEQDYEANDLKHSNNFKFRDE